jgi:hypothetical protein
MTPNPYGAVTPGTKTGLIVSGTATPFVGALVGTLIGGPIGTIVGAIAGLIGLGLATAGGLVDPERSAVKESMLARGTSNDFAAEYAKSHKLDVASLQGRAGTLADKAAKGSQEAIEGLKAIRLLLAEQQLLATQQLLPTVAATPRAGYIPPWAPAAFLGIVLLGLVYTLRRKR